MARNFTKILNLTLAGLLLFLPACGGSGDYIPPVEQAVVTLSLTGPTTDNVGAIQFDLTLPEGFDLNATWDNDLDQWILDDGVINLQVPGTVAVGYLPETPSALGLLYFALIQTADGGFASGELVTVSHDLSATESLPLAVGFTVSNLEVSDGGGSFSGYDIVASDPVRLR